MLLFDAFPAHLSFPHVAGAISPPDTLTRESQAASGLKGSFLMYLPRPSLCCQGAYNCSKSSPSWRSHTSRDSGSLTSFSLARMKQDVGVVSRSRSGAEISSLLMVLERSLGAPGAWMACESPSLHHHGAFLAANPAEFLLIKEPTEAFQPTVSKRWCLSSKVIVWFSLWRGRTNPCTLRTAFRGRQSDGLGLMLAPKATIAGSVRIARFRSKH